MSVSALATPRPLRVLLVDDEPLARLRLAGLLKRVSGAGGLPPIEGVGEAGSADEAEAWLRGHTCDLLLLDIAMPGRDGLKLADALRRLPQPPQVVFVTAHAEHALRAFDLDATDYLTKPVRQDRLEAALARAAQRRPPAAQTPPEGAAESAGTLVFTDRGRVLRLPLAEILYLKAEQKYVSLVAAGGRWLLDESLAELEPRLGAGFLRVHRNALVARAAVRALERGAGTEEGTEGGEGWQIKLANGETLAVSRRQVQPVKEAMSAWAER